jgi:hypothetical protein
MDAQGTAPQLTLAGDVRMSSLGYTPKEGDPTVAEMNAELTRGGRFVTYPYCMSFLIVTLRKRSRVFYLPPGKSAIVGGLPFAGISLLLGWWGFPFGFIFTPIYLVKALAGGTNVTEVVVDLYNKAGSEPAAALPEAAPAQAVPAAPVAVSAEPVAAPAGTAPGWHPDPQGEARLRYYDGHGWTAHTAV